LKNINELIIDALQPNQSTRFKQTGYAQAPMMEMVNKITVFEEKKIHFEN